jgi:hypothetical protein
LAVRSHLLAATIALTLVAVPGFTAHAGGRVALVIGMSGYRHAPSLKNPANDAKDMSTALRELGFAVTEAVDLDKRSLDEAVRSFAHRIAGADAALMFFGGHGLQVAGQNYLRLSMPSSRASAISISRPCASSSSCGKWRAVATARSASS